MVRGETLQGGEISMKYTKARRCLYITHSSTKSLMKWGNSLNVNVFILDANISYELLCSCMMN